MSSALQPTAAAERYVILDVLRGFALFGVLMANMTTHSGYFFLSPSQQNDFTTASADGVIMWLLHFLVEGKFYSMFSLLFGIGFALQMGRSEKLQTNFSGLYRRRLFILFVIGLLHAIIFYVGDILTVYAITGFFLLLFRKASNRTLVRSAMIFMLLPLLQYGIFWGMAMISGPAASEPADQNAPRFFDQLILQYQTGNIADILKNNIGGLIFGRYPELILTGRFFRVLAMFLLGFYVTRRMLFVNLEANRSYLKKVMIWGAVIGIPCNIALAMLMETNAYVDREPLGILQPLVYAFGVPALALFYSSAICLAYSKESNHKLLHIFKPVGQMALTNYLMQSVICGFIFMSYGSALFGKVGLVHLMLTGLVIYVFQVFFSHWWLDHFRFGPMEWVWRSLTYRKWQMIKRDKPVSNPQLNATRT